jgi:hypothetical protein
MSLRLAFPACGCGLLTGGNGSLRSELMEIEMLIPPVCLTSFQLYSYLCPTALIKITRAL